MNWKTGSLSRAMLAVLCVLTLTACPNKRPGKTKVFANRPASRPASKPAMARPRGPFQQSQKPVEQGEALALQLKGQNSIAQLKIELAELPAESHTAFSEAYRLVFCADRSKRNPARARQLLGEILSKHQNYGPAYRAMAYTHIDQGFNIKEAITWYQRGIKAAPNYGLNYYALAFSLAGVQQLEAGFEAFQKAMALGVKDERNLKQRFFANFNKGIKTH